MVRDRELDRRQAKALLGRIPKEKKELRRRLLLAAAITKLMDTAPIVVGGTAEEYWAGGEYHATDLDLCPPPSPTERKALGSVGLRKMGRHWVADGLPVAVEFPGLGDDIERTEVITVGGVSIRMIGREDLYLDRVRQATVGWPREDISFDSALEIALTNFSQIDWDYTRERIARIKRHEARVGDAMAGVNRRVRSRARRAYLRSLESQRA